jgi:transcriptional regulator with XRE-family HTH domain
MVSDTGWIERQTIIEVARRAAGLTQAELARRAGTSQSAISEYERRRKSPALDVTERLMWAAGSDLAMTTLVEFSEHQASGNKVFYVPNRLWRVEVPQCFAKVELDDRVWDLGVRADRKRLYERLLRSGTEFMIFRWVDAALLGDLWPELELPGAVREAWEPLVRVAAQGQVESAWNADREAMGR